jgi:hypothetical protein
MKVNNIFFISFLSGLLIIFGCNQKPTEKERDTKPNTFSTQSKTDSSNTFHYTKDRKPPPPNGKRIKILLTGDSMIGCLLAPLKKADTLNRYRFYFAAWYGSTSKDWAKSDTLKILIERYKPDYVFFTVGANELLYYSLQKRIPYYDSIVDKLGQTKFVFVGAPNWKPADEYYKILSTVVPNNQLFISKDLPLARRKDGAHPTNSASYLWTDTLCTWLQTKSKYQADFYFNSLKH